MGNPVDNSTVVMEIQQGNDVQPAIFTDNQLENFTYHLNGGSAALNIWDNPSNSDGDAAYFLTNGFPRTAPQAPESNFERMPSSVERRSKGVEIQLPNFLSSVDVQSGIAHSFSDGSRRGRVRQHLRPVRHGHLHQL